MANALVSVQILPKPAHGEDVIPFVDEAIRIIQESGVKHQVQPLDTVMEGEMDELFAIVSKMNKRMMELGCKNVIAKVKVLYQPEGITLETLTEKYR